MSPDDWVALDQELVEARGAIQRVRELHTPVKRWQDSPESTYSWDTEREALDWGDGETATYFEVCGHCAEMEMRHADGVVDYPREALWPCTTIRALDGTA